MTRRVARKANFSESTRDLLHQYEEDPSIELTKNEKRAVFRLQKDQKKNGKRKSQQNMHEKHYPTPTNRDENRRLRITTNGVELEPRGLNRHVPDDEPDDEPDHEPSNDQPRQPRLLRSNYRTPGKFPTNGGDLGVAADDGVQLELRGHDRGVPNHVPTSGNDPVRMSRYPLRSRHRMTGANNSGDTYPKEESSGKGGLLVEDPGSMDIDDISSRTAGVHLA